MITKVWIILTPLRGLVVKNSDILRTVITLDKMQDLGFYFGIGWEHIISRDALDHQLFIAALAAIYLLKDWKQVLILVTAFTIGHSLTLALSVFDIIRFNSKWVEFLIPLTIVVTAIFNLFQKKFTQQSIRINYVLALLFGLIHGMGFANSIRFMLAEDQDIGWSLLGFNLGLEVGQIVVVTGILLLSYLVVTVFRIDRRSWVLFVSAGVFALAFKMLIERVPIKNKRNDQEAITMQRPHTGFDYRYQGTNSE